MILDWTLCLCVCTGVWSGAGGGGLGVCAGEESSILR